MTSFRHPRALPHAEPFEAFAIVAVCFGWFIFGSTLSAWAWHPGTAAGFSDSGLAETVVLELLLGGTAIAMLWSRRYPLRTLYPQPSWSGALAGLALCLCAMLLARLAVPLLPHYPTTPVDEMLANMHVSWPSVVPAMIVNGVFEEVFLLGYLMRGLRRYGASTAIGISLLVRLLYHTYQGPVGVVLVLVFGAVMSLYFQRKGQLFPVVLAHVLVDLAAFL